MFGFVLSSLLNIAFFLCGRSEGLNMRAMETSSRFLHILPPEAGEER